MRHLKVILITLQLLSYNSLVFGQRRNGRSSYNGDEIYTLLADKDEIIPYIVISSLLVIIGVFIGKISNYYKKGDKETSQSTNIGCIGGLFFIAAFFVFIPVLLWIQLIVQSIIILVFVGSVIIGILYLIWLGLSK